MAGKNPTPQNIQNIREKWGFDKPFYVQYVRMMQKAGTGLLPGTHGEYDILRSFDTRQDVVAEIKKGIPATFSLCIGAGIIWLVFGILVGVISAVKAGRWSDRAITIFALIGISMPVFWLGEMANLIPQDRYHNTFLFSWVPPLGYTPFTEDPAMWFKHLVIPWLVLSVLYIGLYARVLRADLIETESEDYVRTARAKGLSGRRVLLRHMLRTSMISFVSLFGLDFGVLVGGGALLVEVVFGLPGVGLLTYQSLISLDLPVIMATVIYGAIFIVFANALVDVAYAWLDPRVRPA
jgi:peptide/nickel transport system permease protein